MRQKHLLGVLDPNSGLIQTMLYVFQYGRDQCEQEGYLWIFGNCFEILRDEVIDIIMESEKLKNGKQILNVYAITETEKSNK